MTTGEGDGTGEGGVVTPLAGVINVAVGTDSLVEDEESLAGRDGGFLLDVGGCGGGRDGGGGLLEDEVMPREDVPVVSAARDWAKSCALVRGEAVFLEMARPCGRVW